MTDCKGDKGDLDTRGADEGHLDEVPVAVDRQPEGASLESVGRDGIGTYMVMRFHAVEHHTCGRRLGHGPDTWVVTVQNRDTVHGKCRRQLRLGLGDGLDRPHAFQMNRVNIRHNTDLRLRDTSQQRDLAQGIGAAHLEHDRFYVIVRFQQREREAYLVVVGAGTAIRLPVLPQHGGNGFLGTRLPNTAGNADHQDVKPIAAPRCPALEPLDRVIDDHERQGKIHLGIGPLPADDGRHGAASSSIRRERVAIEALPANGEVEIAGLHLARVALQRGKDVILRQVSSQLAAGAGQDIAQWVSTHERGSTDAC